MGIDSRNIVMSFSWSSCKQMGTENSDGSWKCDTILTGLPRSVTLGAHAQEGYGSWVCVCVSVC